MNRADLKSLGMGFLGALLCVSLLGATLGGGLAGDNSLRGGGTVTGDITLSGNILPSAADTYTLGSGVGTDRFATAYIDDIITGTIRAQTVGAPLDIRETNGVRFYVVEGTAAGITEPTACTDSGDTGVMAIVDVTDDAAPGYGCFCISTDDGTTFDWRKVNDPTAACAF